MKRNYHFQGTFRSYQQRILNSLDEHLKDGKIHIVAAPGSGKTILGLEIICRLGQPALILSPTVTIQHQWGTRMIESFSCPPEAVSYTIKQPSEITSITYQALHAAMKKENGKPALLDEDEILTDDVADLNFQNFDLFSVIKKAGILESK